MSSSPPRTVFFSGEKGTASNDLADLLELNWKGSSFTRDSSSSDLSAVLVQASCDDVIIADFGQRQSFSFVGLSELIQATPGIKLVLILDSTQVVGSTPTAASATISSVSITSSTNRMDPPMDQSIVRSFEDGEASLELSKRETETLALIMEGKTNKEIAYRLGISPATVKVYLKSLMRKAKVSTRTELAIVGLANSSKEGA